MTCAEAREILLTADLTVLEATDGPVSEHLAACPTCQAVAARILAAHGALRAAVPGSRRPSSLVTERAIVQGRAIVRRRRLLRRIVPTLLAAAAVAAVLLVPRDRLLPGTMAPPTRRASLPPLVEASNTDVAVITTSRPDITIIWQF